MQRATPTVIEDRGTVGRMRPWVIAAPVLIAIELIAIQAVYAVTVLGWRPPALAELQVTAGRIHDVERLCHSVGHPARSSVCHHKVVLADGAGSFRFPRHAVDAAERLLTFNDDRLRPGEHVELWHQPGKPDRVGGSLGAVWQLRGDGWIIPYSTATTMNTYPEMGSLGCGVLMSGLAVAVCVQEARRRRTGRSMRVRAGWETGLMAALAIAAYVTVAMEAPSLVWPVVLMLAPLVLSSLYSEKGVAPRRLRRTP